MNSKIIGFFLSFLFANLIFSQENFSFGKVPKEDIQMKVYQKDTTANAVVLYERGDSRIEKNEYGHVVLSIEYVARIKILKKEGLENATVEIPIRKSKKSQDRFKEAHATSINTDGSIGTLRKENIFTEELNEYCDLVKFTIPNVKVGAVIDYSYKIKSPFFFNFKTWYFQSELPKVYSTYHTSIPANYRYNITLKGSLELDQNDQDIKKDCWDFRGSGSADCAVAVYSMKDIPAFKEENFMVSKYNYLSSINYELKTFEDFKGSKDNYTKTWEDTDKEFKYGEEIGKQARKTSYFQKLLPPNITDITDKTDKAKTIYYQLQKELNWDKEDFIFSNVDVKAAYEKKVGNSSELNLILLNFLKASGLNADFMLLSTRKNALPTKIHPVISDFTYLVVKLTIDDSAYLLDITDKNMPFGLIPFRALNRYGRVMDMDNGSYWFDIVANTNNQSRYHVFIDCESPETFHVKVRETTIGYPAISKRSKIKGKAHEELIEDIQNELEEDNLYIEDYEIGNLEDLEKPLLETYTIVLRREREQSANNFLFNPFIIGKEKSNPFKLEKRTYPIDFGYPFSQSYAVSLNLNDYYTIKDIPESKGIRLENNTGHMLYKIQKINENQCNVVCTLEFKEPEYSGYEYDGLKKIFSELIAVQNKQPLVLEPKTTRK